MTAETLIDTAALRELCERATPGPWEYGIDPCHFDSPEVRNNRWAIYVPTDEDAAFIAAARTALPELLDKVEKLEKDLAAETTRREDAEAERDTALSALNTERTMREAATAALTEWNGGIQQGSGASRTWRKSE